MLGKLVKIVRMEFKLTAANRAFIALTILGPFLIFAVIVLPTLLSQGGGFGSPELKIAIVNADRSFLQGIKPVLEKAGIKVVDFQGDTSPLDAEVQDDKLDGYLILPADLAGATTLEYISKSAGDFRVMGTLQGVIGNSIVAMRLQKTGLTPQEIASVMQQPQISNRQLTKSGEKKESDFLTILMTALALVFLIYMTVLLYGQAIGRSVLTEKTSKTVEIMLSSVSPMDLLWGKILGKVLAAILQYAVWILMSAVFLYTIGPKLGVSLSIGITPIVMVYMVMFFLLDFFLYSGIYAALGAASEDEQHLGQLSWPIILFLVLPMMMISPIIMSPSSSLVVFFSLFPLTGPIVMFLRILVGGVAGWEIALCVGITLVTIVVVVYLSAKIFRVGLLMTGKRFKLGEILKWVRY
jgi:ABC-2 type transport system permease protein